MKKIPILFLFCFLISSLLCGTFCFSSTTTFAEQEISSIANVGQEKHFDNPTEFALYINSYGAENSKDNIILDKNLDMSEHILYGTIGTKENPFMGSFNGNGYIISNLKIYQAIPEGLEQIPENQTKRYVGLFGYVKGASNSESAVIKNIGFDGNVQITLDDYDTTAYVGTLVGYAENTTIRYIQMTANVTFNTDFSKNIVFGGVAGMISNGCDIRGVICRSDSFGFWNITQKDSRIFMFGGLFGYCEDSAITFSVVDVKFDLQINAEFSGEISLGGVAGSLNLMQMDNIAIDNDYAIENKSTNPIDLGEVVGKLIDSDDGSLCYIYYKQNSNVPIFGELGHYNFVQQNAHIEQSLQDLNSLTPSGNGYSYFEANRWHPFRDKWDFQKEFYVGSSKIFLQSFYGDFRVGFQNQNPTILTCTSANDATYRYGQSATLTFSFNINEDGTNMIDYYEIRALSLNGSQIASINFEIGEENSYSYSFSGLENRFSIANEINGFSITILSINNSLSGNYSLTIQPRDFVVSLSSRLFVTEDSDDIKYEDENADVKVPIIPGNVFEYNPTGTKNPIQRLNGLIYLKAYTLDTERKAGTLYTHFGWCILYEDGSLKNLDSNKSTGALDFVFGKGDFTKQAFTGENGQKKISAIVAKYVDDACELTFQLGNGIERVELYSGRTVIDEAETEIYVSKTADLTMTIYVDKKYDFNTEKLIEELSIYAGGSNESGFCVLEQSSETDNEKYYVFRLNMTKLISDFKDGFTINVKAEEFHTDNLTWLWWTLGVLGGLIVIGLVVFLIIFFVRRKGGGSGGYKAPTKKSYKGMYY